MKLKPIEVVNKLNELFPDPKPSLDYNNDFELLVSILLSAQTTDKVVNIVTKDLYFKYPNVYELSKADIKEVENIIKKIGIYHNKSKNIIELSKMIINDFNGIIPCTREELMKLPGVGRKTANVFLAIYYKQNVMPVDTHIKRCSYKLGISKKEDNLLTIENKLIKFFKGHDLTKIHLQLIYFGRNYCKSKTKDCKILIKHEK